jgi:hypothetical protein
VSQDGSNRDYCSRYWWKGRKGKNLIEIVTVNVERNTIAAVGIGWWYVEKASIVEQVVVVESNGTDNVSADDICVWADVVVVGDR